jgi:methyl-accepting chemotaxis protein
MTNEMAGTQGTQAHAPDLDWSQVRETVLMMELSAGQIEAAMRDSNSSVEVLTDVFTTMAGYMRMISDTVAALPDENKAKANLLSATEHVSGMVHQAIIAFQFYDKLVQRLSHVNHSLASLSSLVSDQSRLYKPYEWVALQEKIRSKYSMREEVEMFEAVLGGMSVEEALEKFMTKINNKSDDIELF